MYIYIHTHKKYATPQKKMMNWPEPIVRVQSLSESCLCSIPDRYVKPPNERPITTSSLINSETSNIPVIDLGGLYGSDSNIREKILSEISEACREWGFFQIVNHGVSTELLDKTRQVWRDFFHLPMEIKQLYANNPKTYEGYGSRLGVQKGAILDWSDYYYLHYLPLTLKDYNKWPSLPPNSRFLSSLNY